MDPKVQGAAVSSGVTWPGFELGFAHNWSAEILPARPAILPARHFVYPRDAEEVERGALEVLIRPRAAGGSEDSPCAQPFLATCALGFRDPAVPTGLWSAPNADEICCVSGGYAYLISTAEPARFTMIPYRPVLHAISARDAGLLLFIGHRSILAWGPNGQAWESEKLSDEGVTITAVDDAAVRGLGWQMLTDKETPFALDLRTGLRVSV
jgi:hypothetical protein